jgi:hypothetical protein
MRRALLVITLAAVAACHHRDERFPLAIDVPTTATWTIGDTTIETDEGGHSRAQVEETIRGEGRDVLGSEPLDNGWRVRAVDRASKVVVYTYRTVDDVGLLCGNDAAGRCAGIRDAGHRMITIPVANGDQLSAAGVTLVIDGDACQVVHEGEFSAGLGTELCRGLRSR